MNRSFFDVICAYSRLLKFALQFAIVLLLLLLFSFVFLQSGTSSYYIAIINLLMLVPILIVAMALLYVCGKRRSRKTIDTVESVDTSVEENQ